MSDAAALKEEGNAKFKSQQYAAAVDAYTRSLELDEKQHLVLSNRSAAYLKLGGAAEQALRDAEQCIKLVPAFAKGYSRQAAALQQLNRWEEAVKVCEQGLAAVPDDKALKQMHQEVKNRSFQYRLQGPWHGRVHEELGDYEQEMEFMEGGQLRVQVMGRSVEGNYQVDCAHDPIHMDIAVQAPPMPYIVKLDDAGLHLSCPYADPCRPQAFEGPGYCLMRRGKLPPDNFEEELAKLSNDEKLLLCVREIIKALPNRKLEEPLQTDSQEVIKEKMMTQVRFEGEMYKVQKKFGEEFTKEVLSYAKEDSNIPAALAKTQDLKKLRDCLCVCGLMEGPFSDSAPASASPPPAAPSSGASAASPEKKTAPTGARETAAQPGKKASSAADGSSLTVSVAVASSLAIGAAVLAGWLLWQRRRR